MENIYRIAKALRESDMWDLELAEQLCDYAGMIEEWLNADGDSFEEVVYAAAEKLGVEI